MELVQQRLQYQQLSAWSLLENISAPGFAVPHTDTVALQIAINAYALMPWQPLPLLFSHSQLIACSTNQLLEMQ